MSVSLALHLSVIHGIIETQGLEKAMELVASSGYEGVEFTEFYDLPVSRIRAALTQNGLRPVSSYVELSALRDGLSKLLDYHTSLGVRYLVCAGSGGVYDYPALAEELRDIAVQTSVYGMTLCYHHHMSDLQPDPDGRLWLDTLLGPVDEGISLVADTYWAERAGLGAAALLNRYPDRCPLLHLGDMRDPVSYQRAELGSGVINMIRAVEQAKAKGVEWLIVDQNGAYADPQDTIRRSVGSLLQLTMEV